MKSEWLYIRPPGVDTECPRECHLQAMLSAYKGEKIPKEVYEAVLNSASLNKPDIKRRMDDINSQADEGVGTKNFETNTQLLAIDIVRSWGIDGPGAAERRLNHLKKYFYELLLVEEFGSTE